MAANITTIVLYVIASGQVARNDARTIAAAFGLDHVDVLRAITEVGEDGSRFRPVAEAKKFVRATARDAGVKVRISVRPVSERPESTFVPEAKAKAASKVPAGTVRRVKVRRPVK